MFGKKIKVDTIDSLASERGAILNVFEEAKKKLQVLNTKISDKINNNLSDIKNYEEMISSREEEINILNGYSEINETSINKMNEITGN